MVREMAMEGEVKLEREGLAREMERKARPGKGPVKGIAKGRNLGREGTGEELRRKENWG